MSALALALSSVCTKITNNSREIFASPLSLSLFLCVSARYKYRARLNYLTPSYTITSKRRHLFCVIVDVDDSETSRIVFGGRRAGLFMIPLHIQVYYFYTRK